MIALHRHDSNDHQQFSETTTGLDHASFAVPSRRDLEVWQTQPLTQSPIADEPYASVLVFSRSDNIQLELFAPAATRDAGS
jgi:hypothetical protein